MANLNSKEREAYDFFSKLARFRKSSPAIASGRLKQFIPQNGVYVYFRIHRDQKLMCVLNTASANSNISMERFDEELSQIKNLKNIFTGDVIGKAKNMTLPGKSFVVYELSN